MKNKKTVIIAGAGLSGLTLGTALAQRGWNVQILERSYEPREIGAGLYTWENGLKVLEALGAFDEACKDVEFITSLEMIDEKLEKIHATKFTPDNRFCIIPRRNIHTALIRAAQRAGVKIETNVHVASAEPSGTITLEDGQTLKADLVVDAEGVHSQIRHSLDIVRESVKVDNGALRTMIPRLEEDGSAIAQEFWSGYRRIGVGPSTPQSLYVYLTAPSTDEEALTDPINKEAWISSFPHLESVINRIERTGLDRYFYYVFLKSWSMGRVALMGDAAHAMEPNLGQGAGVSMISALELARQLDQYDIDLALKTWEVLVRPTVETTQRWSKIYGIAASKWPKELLDIRSEVIRQALKSENVDALIHAAARYIVGSSE